MLTRNLLISVSLLSFGAVNCGGTDNVLNPKKSKSSTQLTEDTPAAQPTKAKGKSAESTPVRGKNL